MEQLAIVDASGMCLLEVILLGSWGAIVLEVLVEDVFFVLGDPLGVDHVGRCAGVGESSIVVSSLHLNVLLPFFDCFVDLFLHVSDGLSMNLLNGQTRF